MVFDKGVLINIDISSKLEHRLISINSWDTYKKKVTIFYMSWNRLMNNVLRKVNKHCAFITIWIKVSLKLLWSFDSHGLFKYNNNHVCRACHI